MRSDASSAARNPSDVPTSSGGAFDFTATPVRTLPSAARERPSRSPDAASVSIIASVTIITSHGSPASSASFIAPTAPKRPSIARRARRRPAARAP
jgi:hypothetical protein